MLHWQVAQEVVDHPLEEEIAEGHAAQAGLGAGNGIEDGGVGLVGVEDRGALPRSGLTLSASRLVSATFGRKSGACRVHAGMEEGIAVAVGIEAISSNRPEWDFSGNALYWISFPGGGRANAR